ncbi:MAG: hypothetical protein JNJ44_09085 [Zoogloeaceae bacterium]|nr:hypothetical protein [Zoogloeaceae bacterium]
MAEHQTVLASVQEVQTLVAQGNVEIGRALAQALADWFPEHANYMDSAIATWLVRRTANGAPLVFRRTPTPTA